MISNKLHHIIISFLFIAILLLVFINQYAGFLEFKVESHENRELAKLPELNIKRLDYFPKQYDSYYNDHFQNRSQFVTLMSFISRDIFKKSLVKKNFIIGEDNFVFDMKDLNWYLGKLDFTENQIEKLTTEFRKREEYFNQRNIEMYILICPSKYSVYNEKLPPILQINNNNRTDKFIQLIRNNTSIRIVDGRESLKKRKRGNIVYLKHDTHWNNFGAFSAIIDLTDSIRIDFPQIPHYLVKDLIIDTIKKTDGNLKHVLPNAEQLFEFEQTISIKEMDIKPCVKYIHLKPENYRYSQWEYCRRFCTKNSNDSLKAIVFRDSYANSTFKLLPSYFEETLYIWDDWKFKLNPEIIEKEKPDIVIYSIYEGYLDRILLEPTFVEPDVKVNDVH